MAHQKMLCLWGACDRGSGRERLERADRRKGNLLRGRRRRPVGQAVKTPASHAGNGGSIPPRVTKFFHFVFLHIYFDIRGRESFDIQSVIITLRTHLFPFRTQKLSSAVLKILGGKLPGKISRRRHQTLFIRTGFFLLSGSIWHLSAGIAMVLRNFLTASAILVKNTTGGIL